MAKNSRGFAGLAQDYFWSKRITAEENAYVKALRAPVIRHGQRASMDDTIDYAIKVA